MLKTHVLLSILWFLSLVCTVDAEPAPRFKAPSNEQELNDSLKRLRAEYAPYLRSLPKKADARQRQLLDGDGWKFTFESKDATIDPKATPETVVPPAPDWSPADFDDSKWQTTSVPEWRYRTKGDDNAYNTTTIDKFNDYDVGHGTTNAICWYRTTFKAAKPPAGKRLWLCFDGVDWEAEVYLNGKLLGRHRVYYEPFRFDVTDKVEEQNTLAVRVIDGRDYGEPMTYWSVFPDIRAKQQRYVPDRSKSIMGNLPIGYHCGTGFGIHRPVYLEHTGPVLVSEIFVRNDLSDGNTRVKVELDSDAARNVQVTVQLLPENFEGPSYTKTFDCKTPKGPSVETLVLPMPDARVWSPNTPNLYRCRVTVRDGDRMVDVKDVLFGCRSFALVNRKEDLPPNPRTKYRIQFVDKLGVKFRAATEIRPIKAQWLRVACRGSDDGEWNSIWEVDCPAMHADKKNNVTASGTHQDYAASKAVDGNMHTRWAVPGRDSWIQFKLNEAVEFDEVTIGWYEPQRKWDFDLLVSNDGKQWTKLRYEQKIDPRVKKAKSNVELAPHKDLPNGMFVLNGRPCYLRGTNIHGLNAYALWGQTDKLLHTLLLLKAGNFNAIRVCQHVQLPEVREMLDRMGIMSEQEQGGGYSCTGKPNIDSLPMGVRRPQHIHTGTVLARQTYNNPGVVLLCFGNEHHFDTEPILRAALAVDPQRIFVPISGATPLNLPADLMYSAIEDLHPYSGWYGGHHPQTWRHTKRWNKQRQVTLGEFGAEAMDAYETMRDHYPEQAKPPAPETDTLWAASQTKKHDIRQIVGLGRKPTNLAEYIEASQNYQESLLADKVIGMRLSPRAIAGYFQFHFIDAVPAFWPKSIVSHDHRPKKAYYQLAQLNQPVVPLAQLTGEKPDAMILFVANDLPEPMPQCTLRWNIGRDNQTLLQGEQRIDVPAIGIVQGNQIDLTPVTAKHPNFELTLTLTDAKGNAISRNYRHVRCVPHELLKK